MRRIECTTQILTIGSSSCVIATKVTFCARMGQKKCGFSVITLRSFDIQLFTQMYFKVHIKSFYFLFGRGPYLSYSLRMMHPKNQKSDQKPENIKVRNV